MITIIDEILGAKLLFVDDDKYIIDLLKITFNKEQFHNIYTANNGQEAIQICKKINIDLILLDVMLPDCDGFILCRQLREITNVPILFLTAKITDLDELSGFAFGGDDYIKKPFNPLKVVARVKAQLNRKHILENISIEKTVHNFNRFQVYAESGKLIVNGEQVECPAREFQLLVFLCQNPDIVFSKKQLYRRVWNDSFGDESTVMVHIRRLRQKIEIDPSNPQYIITVRGLGYKLQPENTEVIN
ncbi:response regulator transcription factor [Clostridium mobile]|uniref:response regulator transcription factor n=1 Tax=Clostridium mobile TaxID=2841512 RepID=UPI0031B7FB8E